MKVLVDTNVYSGALRSDPTCTRILQTADSLFLSPVVLGELLFGFRAGRTESRNREQLAEFLRSSRVAVLSVTERTAEYFALILTQLKDEGHPIPSNDAWIAASALEHGLTLATRDAHFQAIRGLLLWRD